jgi:hypothetical protein
MTSLYCDIKQNPLQPIGDPTSIFNKYIPDDLKTWIILFQNA